jgi:hypothetical protein
MAYAPHCDASILHAPGACEFCDQFRPWQEYRIVARVNFTGEHEDGKAPCPSEYFRPAEVRDRWPNNRPARLSDPMWPFMLETLPSEGMIERLGNRLRASRHKWTRGHP